jgi:hypothetical protein
MSKKKHAPPLALEDPHDPPRVQHRPLRRLHLVRAHGTPLPTTATTSSDTTVTDEVAAMDVSISWPYEFARAAIKISHRRDLEAQVERE